MFTFAPLALPDVVLVQSDVHTDARGWFSEGYRRSDFTRAGLPMEFVQDNHSFSSRRGTLRGLHLQLPPAAQGKLVRAAAGSVFDVAVDVRSGSETFGRWVSAVLEGGAMLWIPPGFAHGFCTLADDTLVVYKTTAEYDPRTERAIRWNDPQLAIPWPTQAPMLNAKDRDAPALNALRQEFLAPTVDGGPGARA